VEIIVFDSAKAPRYRGFGTSDVKADSVVNVTIDIRRIQGGMQINGKIIDSLPAVALTQGLLAYYPFNGNAADESDHGHNGVVHGATLVADRLNKANKAYSFDGSDTIMVDAADSLNFGTGDFSICFWIKAPIGKDCEVMGKCNGAIPYLVFTDTLCGPGWNIQLENTPKDGRGIRLDLMDGAHFIGDDINDNPATLLCDTSALDNKWHFVVFTVDRDAMAGLYVDCVKKDELSVANIGSLSNNEPLRIGRRNGLSESDMLVGSLDQIRFYKRVISPAEMGALFNETL
jgi:hypothetical protein